jgi:biopolymer transport protein ExbD
MNSNQLNQTLRWFAGIFVCLVLILISLIVASDLPELTKVVIDNKSAVSLGGVVPLQNKKVRDSVLRIMSHLPGTKLTIVADKSARFSTIVEVMDSICGARAMAMVAPPHEPAKQSDRR